MALTLDLQLACDGAETPGHADLRRWAEAALCHGRPSDDDAELTIRIVDTDEGAALNQRYRARPGPTNVLSFPFESPPGIDSRWALLGDLVICAPVVARETVEQGKSRHAHWAHLVVHGVLHLIGHDHQDPAEAETMETLETVILAGLGFPPPYSTDASEHA